MSKLAVTNEPHRRNWFLRKWHFIHWNIVSNGSIFTHHTMCHTSSSASSAIPFSHHLNSSSWPGVAENIGCGGGVMRMLRAISLSIRIAAEPNQTNCAFSNDVCIVCDYNIQMSEHPLFAVQTPSSQSHCWCFADQTLFAIQVQIERCQLV